MNINLPDQRYFNTEHTLLVAKMRKMCGTDVHQFFITSVADLETMEVEPFEVYEIVFPQGNQRDSIERNRQSFGCIHEAVKYFTTLHENVK